ncbi:MAG TPA: hypothetical protein VGY77_03010 [Gemmataceae bacterium]|nr:hypothetical protein [Gemmataceae bacterium]
MSALLLVAVGRPAGHDVELKIVKEKVNLALVVTLRFPRDMEYAKIHKILEKVKDRGATKVSVTASKGDEIASGEVVAQPQTPSKRVAAVVEELLGCGITKIFIEVKK